MDESALENMIRTGTVSSINTTNHTARVNFKDKNNMTSGPLSMLKHIGIISVGDFVLCLFPPNGEGDGFIIGEVR